jgi:hypothetical protein
MNLFLGYYLPFCHSTPLWEMESDYYLHNFHVKAGRGSTYSMKTYERAFGIEWSNGEDGDGVNEDSVASTPSQTRPTNTRPPSIKRSSSRDVAAKQTQVESQRISRVRNRCKTQNDVLSMWWKVALQSYVQQRMWMKLGMSKSESLLPPRYERLYQPEKIAQFDRFFARGWAAPVRRSHTAQQSEGSERDAEGLELRRVISGRRPESEHEKAKVPPEAHILKDFVDNHGFAPRYESSLKRFAAHHDISRSTSAAQSFDYVGRLDSSEAKEHEEYLRYVAKSSSLFDAPHSYQKETVSEFKACLHDYSLKADDVAGICKVRFSRLLQCLGLWQYVYSRIHSFPSWLNRPILTKRFSREITAVLVRTNRRSKSPPRSMNCSTPSKAWVPKDRESLQVKSSVAD